MDEGPLWRQLKRWRYAVPRGAAAGDCRPLDGPVLLAGDALTGVDLGAVHASGLRAADAALALVAV